MLPLKSNGSTVFEARMRLTLLRILKHGLPTAVLLALLGFLMAEIASMWVASQPAPSLQPRVSIESPTDESTSTVNPDAKAMEALRYQLPLEMAVWGFGLVVLCEVVLAFWRGKKQPQPLGPGLRPPSDAEVEELLNQLLQQAEEAEAARNAAANKPTDTPPPCPDPTRTDNTPVSN
jgi:hypothetical protein